MSARPTTRDEPALSRAAATIIWSWFTTSRPTRRDRTTSRPIIPRRSRCWCRRFVRAAANELPRWQPVLLLVRRVVNENALLWIHVKDGGIPGQSDGVTVEV